MKKEHITKAEEAIGLKGYYLVGPDKNREIFYGDYSLVGSVLSNEAGITDANSKKPMISTFGLGPCVALGGYDRKTKMAFLSHNIPLKKLEELNDPVFEYLRKRKVIFNEMDFYLVGGDEEYKSHPEEVKKYLHDKVGSQLKIVHEDVIESYDPKRIGKSFILDSREGRFYSKNLIQIPEETEIIFKSRP